MNQIFYIEIDSVHALKILLQCISTLQGIGRLVKIEGQDFKVRNGDSIGIGRLLSTKIYSILFTAVIQG